MAFKYRTLIKKHRALILVRPRCFFSKGYKIIHQSVFFNEFMDFNDKMKCSEGIKYLEMICFVFK